MNEIFTNLTQAVEGPAAIVLAAAFIWGILSVVLSPCHLSSIPLIVAYINQQGRISAKRALLISSVFALGILVTISLTALITTAFGRMVGDIGKWGNYFVAVVFFAVGLYLLEVINLPFSGATNIKLKKRGLLAGFILGLIFGAAVGPCTFAYMAPILGVTIKTASTNLIFAGSLVLIYGLGHCSVIVLAGTFIEIVQKYLNWNEQSSSTRILKKLCGLLILMGGLYLVYTA